jgi:hypothetical protein
MGIHA